MSDTFLGLGGFHVLVTGAAGGIGTVAVKEFLSHGCLVTGLDIKPTPDIPASIPSNYFYVQADLRKEAEVAQAFRTATQHFNKPPQILIANAGITNESAHPPIWEIDVDVWDNTAAVNVRGTFLTIKHFMRSVKQWQDENAKEVENLAIVVTGSETGKFGQEGHAEYASGKAGLQYGLVMGVKNELVRINDKARINAVAPGWVNTPLIDGRLDDPKEMWAEAQATVSLKKIAEPEDVSRAMAFLASHRAAGHISGQVLSVDGGMEGRLLWKYEDVVKDQAKAIYAAIDKLSSVMPSTLSMAEPSPTPKKRLRISLSVDFDALSGYLGTGQDPSNTISDYSAGLFSARVGVPRLLKLFRKYNISSNITWFLPGHSIESFPKETEAIVKSGAEIALHGYSHEGAYQMAPGQERDVLEKCIELATALHPEKRPPVGYRAPLYQIRETTVALLKQHNFLYDSSMNAHDSLPYFLPEPLDLPPPHVPDWSKPAASWMHPIPQPNSNSVDPRTSLIEVPTSWYTEDMTPMGFYPYSSSSHGYVAVDVVEKMWWDRFIYLWENECDVGPDDELPPGGLPGFGSVFTMIWHPESSGRSHIIGMIERFVKKMVDFQHLHAAEGEITFESYESVAKAWKDCAVKNT
ncbi:putative polysaccharide deacetylase family protein [Phaeomoniella chlamydospora]|uniref:Putative polysaccharide deacetylase family protein n=1 Tax=Phaeomoniella chlamydospora TaxID=158046 RepID=A0A0G2E5B5_PHACM|nr:putative polysaccharide deacetylase family protein [Phaeomoniella chlamydospora]